jgi:hypothetical protein
MTCQFLRLLLLLLVTTSPPHAFAAEVKRLAVSSVIGEALTLVTHSPEVGSHLDRNVHEPLMLLDAGFDSLAIATAMSAAKQLHDQTPAERFDFGGAPASEVLTWIDGKRFVPPAEVKENLAAAGSSHLLLITKHRGPARLKLRSGSTGSGYLEGLGFYVDRGIRVRRADTGEAGMGFLAPYAYFQVLLINVETGEIEKSETVAASTSYSAARSKESPDPWDALSSTQKSSAIRRLLRGEVARVTATLLQ